MFKFVCGVISLVAYGFSYYLLSDITWQEVGGVGVLALACFTAHISNEKG